MSDRLGNYIFQLPIKLLKVEMHANDDFNGFFIDFKWNKKLLNNIPDCILTSFIKQDNNFLSSGLIEYNKSEQQFINTGSLDIAPEFSIWRTNPNLLLYNDKLNFIKQINIVFNSTRGDRKFNDEIIKIYSQTPDSKRDYVPYIKIIEDVMSENELENNELISKLYGKNKHEDEENTKDLVNLIQRYGSNGVYLLDPYLTYKEILKTLYYSNIENVPLRAITSKEVLKNYKKDDDINNVEDFIKLNKENFENLSNNFKLNFEFRIEKGKKNFHDRFLIFLGNDKQGKKPKVFSLGTSINGFNKSVHLLQELPKPQQFVSFFEFLWSELEDEEYLIWKHN